MNTGKSYNQILQDSIDRTKANMEKEENHQKRLVMSFHIQYLEKQKKKKRTGLQSVGGKVCDVIDNLQ